MAGLEGHAEYRALLTEEAALVRRADSLAGEIASLRGRLRTDTLGRAAISAAIVGMEERGFEMRSSIARLASRINTIEQEWILANLAGAAGTAIADSTDRTTTPPFGHTSLQKEGKATRNGAFRAWFETGLSAEQSAELGAARRAEAEVPSLVDLYKNEHARLASLARAYNAATAQAPADSILTRFNALGAESRALLERIAAAWAAAFDSKSYIYNLLADKNNHAPMLRRFEEGLERMREQRPAAESSGAPDPLIEWTLGRRMLADYEAALAAELGDGAAADSLRAVAAALPGPLALTGLEPVTLTERLFIEYADVKVGGSPYNASNPIPDVVVWPRGVMWRVLVGNFTQRQSPSVFRGASPLAVLQGEDKRYRYFAGGFPTDSLAGAAVERLRKAGFRAPAAVVWVDGVYIDPAADDPAKVYRVEIAGTGELPAAVREKVQESTAGSGVDIVRGPQGFMVTPLDAATALRLRTALDNLRTDGTGAAFETRLSKNPE
jgi:hypothetical protein